MQSKDSHRVDKADQTDRTRNNKSRDHFSKGIQMNDTEQEMMHKSLDHDPKHRAAPSIARHYRGGAWHRRGGGDHRSPLLGAHRGTRPLQSQT